MQKKLKLIIALMILLMTLSYSTSAASAWASYSAYLPVNQGDTEVSTVGYAGAQKYMTVDVDSIGSGFTAVRAWAETKNTGKNLTNVYRTLTTSKKNKCTYMETVKTGKNIVLNLDNPVESTKQPLVKGSWTPN